MANPENITRANKRRTSKEAAENGRKGGKASVIARRQKKDIRKIAEEVLSMPLKSGTVEQFKKGDGLSDFNKEGRNLDALTAMVTNMTKKAISGDTKAATFIMNALGSEKEDAELKLKAKELELKEAQIAHEQARLKLEADEAAQRAEDAKRYMGIPAMLITPKFVQALRDIVNHVFTEFIFPGGRGSTKSSFISLAIVDLIEKNPAFNAVIFRNYEATIADSVLAQMEWAIESLGLRDEYKITKKPAMITKKSTKQKIYFRGVKDNPGKIKSIKPKTGYLAIAWFEELDQFAGPNTIRTVEQSVIRGGDIAYIFKSFNPPKSVQNWANQYIKPENLAHMPNAHVYESCYLDVPPEFLGQPFFDKAEELKELNPKAYENEYLGLATGDGGNVFDNLDIREITDKEISEFDRLYQGVDWGYYPDPFHFGRMHYDAARMTLYIFGELRANKKGNEETAQMVKDKFNVRDKNGRLIYSINDTMTYCDSAEPKSVQDFIDFGIDAREVKKGPGSVEYSMKWLGRLKKIVIDPVRCPATVTEFRDYEFERDSDGNITSGYPDANNHAIDMVRYAMYPVWRRRGQ